jgi:membrane fusion protein (multidrug efflux system)
MKNTVLVRVIGVVIGLLFLFGSIVMFRSMMSQSSPPKRKAEARKAPVVEVMQVQNSAVRAPLEVQGTLVAYDKIDIFAEVSGVLEETSRPFKVGTYFPKGSLMIKVNDEEARLSILSQKSSLLNGITQMMPDLKIDYPESFEHWNAYLNAFEMDSPIRAFPEPVNDQEKYFIASRNLLTQYYNIRSAESRLEKYSLEAPFNGVLTNTGINPGALVRVGQKLGELMQTGRYELEVTVALDELKYLQPGNQVVMVSEDIEGKWTGKVKRISDQIDANTQTVKVFIEMSGQNLREGMYLKGEVAANPIQNAVSIPKELLINQNSVYTVQDSTLILRSVELIKLQDNSAIVKGLPDGMNIVKKILPGMFEGMKVSVTKDNQLSDAQPETTDESRPN